MSKKNIMYAVAALLAILLLKNCFGEKEISAERALAEAKENAENPPPVNYDTQPAGISPQNGGVIVKKEQLGAEYPFTEGEYCEVICENNAIYAIVNGVSYAVNGTAMAKVEKNGGQKIDKIWRDDPNVKGIKISMQPITTAGLNLCK